MARLRNAPLAHRLESHSFFMSLSSVRKSQIADESASIMRTDWVRMMTEELSSPNRCRCRVPLCTNPGGDPCDSIPASTSITAGSTFMPAPSYLCILDAEGNIILHKNLPCDRARFLEAIDSLRTASVILIPGA